MKKRFFILPAILSMMLFASCSSSNTTQEIGKNVDPDAHLASAKSYTWTSNIDQIPNDQVFISPTGVLVFNNESARKMIKDAIQYELDARGYNMKDSTADMLISFYILERADSLRTTNGFVEVMGDKVLTEENVSWTPVEPGTLIINIVDKDSLKMVWQGFASGILKPEDLNDQSKVRQAVSSIFSKFNHNNTTETP